jgi:hypothetical protein
MFPWKDFLMGRIRKIQKQKVGKGQIRKIKKKNNKERWRKEKEEIYFLMSMEVPRFPYSCVLQWLRTPLG